jgi:hypothetical protein
VGIGIELSGAGGYVWIVSFDNNVKMLASFVVCRVICATQGTFRWRVPSLIAILLLCEPPHLTHSQRMVCCSTFVCVRTVARYSLWDVFLVRSRRF